MMNKIICLLTKIKKWISKKQIKIMKNKKISMNKSFNRHINKLNRQKANINKNKIFRMINFKQNRKKIIQILNKEKTSL